MGNLAARLLTAAIAVPLLLALLFWGPSWGWWLLVLAAMGVAGFELFAMTHPKDALAQALGVLLTLSAGTVVYLRSHDAAALLSLIVGVTLLGVLLPLWRLGEMATAGLRMTANVAGPLYVGALLATLALLRRDQGPEYVVFSLTVAWFADTGGYFFGRYLGKTKLYEAVSPKKTRAGFVGSLVGAAVAGLLAHLTYLEALPLAAAVPLAVVAGALGQLGDLAESLLKRSTGVKDSGNILPGHGGILDRIDALLIVSPIVHLYTLWLAPAAG